MVDFALIGLRSRGIVVCRQFSFERSWDIFLELAYFEFRCRALSLLVDPARDEFKRMRTSRRDDTGDGVRSPALTFQRLV